MHIHKTLLIFCLSLSFACYACAQDTLQQKLNKAHAALNKVSSTSKKITTPGKIRHELKTVNKQLSPVRTDLGLPKNTITGKKLNDYSELLKKAQAKLAAYRKMLQRSGGDLKGSHEELQKLIRDSMLVVSKADSAARPAVAAQLVLLTRRLSTTDSSVSIGLDTVNKLLSDVSAAYLQVSDLQNAVSDRQHTPEPSKFKQEANYIWSAPKENRQTSIAKNLGTTYEGQNQVFLDFLDSTWGDRLLAFVLGGLFFVWVFFNYRKAVKPEQKKVIGKLGFRHVTPVPITGAIIHVGIITALPAGCPLSVHGSDPLFAADRTDDILLGTIAGP